MTGPRRLDLHDLVRELCEETKHYEFYMRKLKAKHHVTVNPPLLVQLAAASTPKASVEAGTLRPAGSKPSAAIEAIDALMRIDRDAAAWLRSLGEDDPGNVIQCVVSLAALAPQNRCARSKPQRDEHTKWVTCCRYHQIEVDVRRWWSWARVVTRWDLPPWTPDNTCPLCGTRGSLRVRVVDRLAVCAEDECRETWDETTIGLLADHIRAENHEGEEQAS
ncbi:hypothetical protein [Kribbella sp. NPDC051718]|uniref:DUF7341 domain-containing protein n=1 Tax=Kribbella sp. NPDC051718 TaxID=3155168 RepID=UPI00342114FB